MKNHLYLGKCWNAVFIPILMLLFTLPIYTQDFNKDLRESSGFYKNKGQFYDQNKNPREDLLFMYKNEHNNTKIFLSENTISFQKDIVNKREEKKEGKNIEKFFDVDDKFYNPYYFTSYRTDYTLLGARFSNPEFSNPISNVKINHVGFYEDEMAYNQVTFKNVYAGVDVKFYINSNNEFEYDLIIKSNNIPDFKILVKGGNTRLNNGSLVTSFGDAINFESSAPLVYLGNNDNLIPSKYNFKDSILTIEFNKDSLLNNQSLNETNLIIDPVLRWWGTYVGGTLEDLAFDATIDQATNTVFVCGRTVSSNIATSGVHQVNYAGNYDGFVAAINSSGQRLWTTYIGGPGDDAAIALDYYGGNLYITGEGSHISIATSGTHDIYPYPLGRTTLILKLNAGAGTRVWGSFFKGAYNPSKYIFDAGVDIRINSTGNYLVIGGKTGTYTGMATAGAWNTNVGNGGFNGYVAVFTTLNCTQVWGTYVGANTNNQEITSVDFTAGNQVVATGVGFKNGFNLYNPLLAAVPDNNIYHGFAIYLNNTGNINASTWLSATAFTQVRKIRVDKTNNKYYVIGYSGGQPANMGINALLSSSLSDYSQNYGWIMKFSNLFQSLEWSNFLSGPTGSLGKGMNALGLFIHNSNIYISGSLSSQATANTLTTSGEHLTTYQGGGSYGIYGAVPEGDAYLVKLLPTGQKVWGTLYGGSGDDYGCAPLIGSDDVDQIYLVGGTYSTNNIGTSGTHSPNFKGGGADAYVVRFSQCTQFNPTISNSGPVCYNGSATSFQLSAANAGSGASYSWTGPNGFSSTAQNPTVSIPAGDLSWWGNKTFTLTVTNSIGCTKTLTTTVSVIALPEPDMGNNQVICPGSPLVVSPAIYPGATHVYSGIHNQLLVSNPYLSIPNPTSGMLYYYYVASGCTSKVTSISVLVGDTIPATITSCPGDQTFYLTNSCQYLNNSNALNITATNNCSATPTYSYVLSGATTGTLTSLNGVNFNLGVTTVTATAYDQSYPTYSPNSCTYTVTVLDTMKPILPNGCMNPSYTFYTSPNSCTWTVPGLNLDVYSVDNCHSSLMIAYELSGATTGTDTGMANVLSLSGVTFNQGLTTLIWSFFDGSGNTTRCTSLINIIDTISPTILNCLSGSQSITLYSDINCVASAPQGTYSINVSDNCSGTINYSYTLIGATTGSGTTNTIDSIIFNTGLTNVNWVVTDSSGNSSTCSIKVSVLDTIKPQLLCMQDSVILVNGTIQCNYNVTSNNFDPIITENCSNLGITQFYTLSGATTGTGTTLNGVSFNPGTTNVYWIVTDSSGNSSACSYKLDILDGTLPLITNCNNGASDTLISQSGCAYTINNNLYDANASDNCGNTIQTTFVLTGATTGTGTTLNGVALNNGLTTITWYATNLAGITDSCQFQIHVLDGTLPLITNCNNGASDTLISQSGCAYTINNNLYDANASDNCGNTIQTTFVLTGATTGTGTTLNGVTLNNGLTTITWYATNLAGITDSCQFQIHVLDGTLPVFINCGLDTTIIANNSNCSYSVPSGFLNASASDNCGNTIQTTFVLTGATTGTGTSLFGINFNEGVTIVTWYATNLAGITDSCQSSITIQSSIGTYNTFVETESPTCGKDNGSISITYVEFNTPITITWDHTSDTNLTLDNLSAGNYVFIVTDFWGCTYKDTIMLDSIPNVEVEVLNISNPLCLETETGSIYTLTTGGVEPYNYYWSNGSTTPNIYNIQPTLYSLIVTDNNGCTDSLLIDVECDFSKIPEIISPVNNNGQNDVWIIPGLDKYPNASVEIYNRWGNLVFAANPYQNNWDGKSNMKGAIGNGNSYLPSGTYFYILKLDKDSKPLNGYIELVTY